MGSWDKRGLQRMFGQFHTFSQRFSKHSVLFGKVVFGSFIPSACKTDCRNEYFLCIMTLTVPTKKQKNQEHYQTKLFPEFCV